MDHRPRNHDERAKVIKGLARWASQPDAIATAKALFQEILATPAKQYQNAREAYKQASMDAVRTSDLADEGDDRFDEAFNAWVRTVRDPSGRPCPQELTALLGVSPSHLVQRTHREELARTQDLFAQLEGRPAMRGDPIVLERLKAVVNDFLTLVMADENASRVKLTRGNLLAQATEDFDRAFLKFNRRIQGLLDDDCTLALLPRFLR